MTASIGMIGRSVGKKPTRPSKEKHFGDDEPAYASANVMGLGEDLLRPQQDAPAFCGEHDRFQTDACASERRQRQLQQERYQVPETSLQLWSVRKQGGRARCSDRHLQAKLLEKGRFEAARTQDKQLCNENAENQALTRAQERVWGNKGSTDFNILNLHGAPSEPAQVCCVAAHQLAALDCNQLHALSEGHVLPAGTAAEVSASRWPSSTQHHQLAATLTQSCFVNYCAHHHQSSTTGSTPAVDHIADKLLQHFWPFSAAMG